MKTIVVLLVLAVRSGTAALAIGNEAEDVRHHHLEALAKLDQDLTKLEREMAAKKFSKADQRKAVCPTAVGVLGMFNESIWRTTENYRQNQVSNLESLRIFESMILDSADLAKKKACYDFADAEYRRVIETFVGSG